MMMTTSWRTSTSLWLIMYPGIASRNDLHIATSTATGLVFRVMKGNFGAAWEELGGDYELEDTFQLPFKTMEEAVKQIVTYLGLQPCERSDKVPEGKSSHTLLLSGLFRGGIEVTLLLYYSCSLALLLLLSRCWCEQS